MAASAGKNVFSAEELADFKKMFDTYDSDKSGEVKKEKRIQYFLSSFLDSVWHITVFCLYIYDPDELPPTTHLTFYPLYILVNIYLSLLYFNIYNRSFYIINKL